MYAEKLQFLFEKAKGNAGIEQDIMDSIQNILNYKWSFVLSIWGRKTTAL